MAIKQRLIINGKKYKDYKYNAESDGQVIYDVVEKLVRKGKVKKAEAQIVNTGWFFDSVELSEIIYPLQPETPAEQKASQEAIDYFNNEEWY